MYSQFMMHGQKNIKSLSILSGRCAGWRISATSGTRTRLSIP